MRSGFVMKIYEQPEAKTESPRTRLTLTALLFTS